MRSKTKIIVLHMKEVVYTGIFLLLGILFIVLLLIMFSDKNNTQESEHRESAQVTCYQPGIYTQTLSLGNEVLQLEITLDADHINSIQLKNVSEAVTTMYPLIQPVFDDLISQIEEKQSLNNLTISDEQRYTSTVLIDAIENTLAKARTKVQ